jgi:hypothetical protein
MQNGVLWRVLVCLQAYKHEAILGLYVCFVHGIQLWMVMPYMEVRGLCTIACCDRSAAVSHSCGSRSGTAGFALEQHWYPVPHC